MNSTMVIYTLLIFTLGYSICDWVKTFRDRKEKRRLETLNADRPIVSATIHKLYAGGIVSPEQKETLIANDDAITQCLNTLKEAGIPQGLIVAVLHGHACRETINMLSDEP